MKKKKIHKKRSLIYRLCSLPFKILVLLYTPIYLSVEFIYKMLFSKNVSKMGGIDFEYYIAQLLRDNGYKNVEVTAISNDYGIDVFATKRKIRYAIQCKRYSKRVGVEAVQQAASGCIYHDYDIAVVLTNSNFSYQAINLAKCLDVELWGNDILLALQAKARFRKYKYFILVILCIFLLLIRGILL